jgi:hypothetical protein
MENGHLQRQINRLSPSRRKEAIDLLNFYWRNSKKKPRRRRPYSVAQKAASK